MYTLKKWTAILTAFAMLFSSTHNAQAEEYATDAGGCAYEYAYTSCCVAPAIALALVAIAGIIAVGVQNRHHSSHSHSHSD